MEKEKMSEKEIVNVLDELNKDSFKYVGVIYPKSGSKDFVNDSANFIVGLNVKPVKTIKIIDGKSYLEKRLGHAVIVHPSSNYVNIYELKDVHEHFKDEYLSKRFCFVLLKDIAEVI